MSGAGKEMKCKPQKSSNPYSYELDLISGATGHCLALTNDAASVTGILVAAKIDGD